MTNTLDTAARQYATRPADERFPSLQAMITAAQYDKDHSAERTYNLRDLRAVALTDAGNVANDFRRDDPTQTRPNGSTIVLESPKGRADFTHYSFGQLARTLKAPAGYLRTLPPAIAADALNYGLQDAAPVGTSANLLIRANGGTPVVRAATSDSYGRVWDADLYGELARHFGDEMRTRSSEGGTWMSPPTWSGEPAGQYRGDRDSFVIRVDGGSIVDDPSARDSAAGNDGRMFRGIMVRNSEVGHTSITVECLLFRFICGNHMLWGAQMDRTFRRRHVGTKITRDTMQELSTLAWKFNSRSASADEAIVQGLIRHEVAHTKEAVIDELKKMGATKEQATEAYATAEAKEPGCSPRSFWGLAQGLTRNSQDAGYQDERFALDLMAASLLARGAALVVV